jgi:hypothetical protein
MDRDSLLRRLIDIPVSLAFEWLDKQNFVLKLNRNHAPTAWIREIVQRARDGESGGVVEQHLVGAKLVRRFSNIEIANHPAHAADLQTGRDGDFVLHDAVYHVTSAPSRNVIQKCAGNLRAGKRPILIVPSDLVYKAQAFAEDMQIQDELMILPIEGFISTNILELSIAENKDFYVILGEIIALYNTRLEAVETDRSLRISLE